MATSLGTLLPTSDFANPGSWLTDSGGSTNLYLKIDEGISGAVDTNDYIKGAAGGNTALYQVNFTDMPSDFLGMATLSINVRYAQTGRVDDTLGLTVIVKKSDGTAFTNTLTVNANITATAYANLGATAFTIQAAGLSASRTDWNGAYIEFSQSYSASKSNDSAAVTVSAVELTGTYNQALTQTSTEAEGLVDGTAMDLQKVVVPHLITRTF